jgi:hypothetical protein
MVELVLLKINYNISLQSLYLWPIRGQYFHSSIEDPEIVCLFIYLFDVMLPFRWISQILYQETSDWSVVLNFTCFLKYVLDCKQNFIFHISIPINCNQISEGLLYTRTFCFARRASVVIIFQQEIHCTFGLFALL